MRELRTLIANGMPAGDAQVRLRRYRKSLAMLEQARPDTRLVDLLRFVLEALDQLPPAPGGAASP